MTSDTIDLKRRAEGRAPATVRVLFFGRLADAFGRSMSVTIPAEGCSIAGLETRIGHSSQVRPDALHQPGVRVAIDQQMICAVAWVSPGQEVAFLPAFSGG